MAEDFRQRAAKRAKELQSGFWWTVPVGKTLFRVLPTPPGKVIKNEVFFDYKIHRDVGVLKRTVRCGLNQAGKGVCFLCAKAAALRKAGKEDTAAALTPQSKTLFQIALYDKATDEWTGPFGWNPSKGTASTLLDYVSNDEIDYVDPDVGHNIQMKRTGTGQFNTEYELAHAAQKVVPQEITDKLRPFEELKEIGEYEEARQVAAWEGVEFKANAQPDPKDKPRRRPTPEEVDEVEPAPVDDDLDPTLDDEGDGQDDYEDPASVVPARRAAAPVAVAAPARRRVAPVAAPEPEGDFEDEPVPVAPVRRAPTAPTPQRRAVAPAPVAEPEYEDEQLDESTEPELAPPVRRRAPVAPVEEVAAPPVRRRAAAPVVDVDAGDDDAPPPPVRRRAAPVAAPEPEVAEDDVVDPPPPARRRAPALVAAAPPPARRRQ